VRTFCGQGESSSEADSALLGAKHFGLFRI